MNAELKGFLFSLIWRVLLAGMLLMLGTAIFLASGPAGALVGFCLYLAASILLAIPIASMIASAFDRFLWSKSYYDKPQPMYGIPQSRRACKRPEEAIAEYEKILAQFPLETLPWLEMVAIAIEDLRDPERARSILERGQAALAKPEDRLLLAQTYSEILTRLDVPPSRPPIPFPAPPAP